MDKSAELVCIALVLTATDPDNAVWFASKTNEEKAAWVRKQLEESACFTRKPTWGLVNGKWQKK